MLSFLLTSFRTISSKPSLPMTCEESIMSHKSHGTCENPVMTNLRFKTFFFFFFFECFLKVFDCFLMFFNVIYLDGVVIINLLIEFVVIIDIMLKILVIFYKHHL